MSPVVLNVEDSLDDVLLLKNACRRANVGFHMQFVEDGELAIQYLSGNGEFSDRAKHPLPSLILLDLNMPRRSGLEVLQWVKNDRQLGRIPVAIFTSSSNQKDISACLSHGADCYLSKPLSYEALVSLVQKLDAALRNSASPDLAALRQLPESCAPT